MKTTSETKKRQMITAAFADLQAADRALLLDLWRDTIGTPPPKNLSLPFLRRALAFELQCAAIGRPKGGTLEDLNRIAAGKRARASVGAKLQPGTRLVREWRGRSWTIEVIDDGFLMSGNRYDSLSAIAKKITGAHWSGPRFFGLHGDKSKEELGQPDASRGKPLKRKAA
jgi:hypothetical protein